VDMGYFSPVKGVGFMAANFWRAVWAWLISFGVAMIVSVFTKPKSNEELKGLVWGMTRLSKGERVPWFKTPEFWGAVTMILFVVLNVALW